VKQFGKKLTQTECSLAFGAFGELSSLAIFKGQEVVGTSVGNKMQQDATRMEVPKNGVLTHLTSSYIILVT